MDNLTIFIDELSNYYTRLQTLQEEYDKLLEGYIQRKRREFTEKMKKRHNSKGKSYKPKEKKRAPDTKNNTEFFNSMNKPS